MPSSVARSPDHLGTRQRTKFHQISSDFTKIFVLPVISKKKKNCRNKNTGKREKMHFLILQTPIESLAYIYTHVSALNNKIKIMLLYSEIKKFVNAQSLSVSQ